MTFAQEVVGDDAELGILLRLAWVSWILSLCLILASFYLSSISLGKTLRDLNSEEDVDDPPGGWWSRWTTVSTAAGGALFIVGAVMVAVLVSANLP